jgi:anthranilate synthase/phosphoribosyltransferase
MLSGDPKKILQRIDEDQRIKKSSVGLHLSVGELFLEGQGLSAYEIKRANVECKMILVIDNFDSFTYNLVQYLGELGAELRVFRNNAITPEQIAELQPAGIVISPGPGRPEEAGITVSLIPQLAGKIPILGVCLGHQGIGVAFGGEVVRAPELMHGKVSTIHHDGKRLFGDIENPFIATRYHSLVIAEASLPPCLEISARSESGLIMGVRHREFFVEGVQFHPESIMTTAGKSILKNFLQLCTDHEAAHTSSFVQQSASKTAFHNENNSAYGATAQPSIMPISSKPKKEKLMIQQAIQRAIDRVDLDRRQAYEVMDEIMGGAATPAQIAAFLVAMRMKGERVQEVAGLAQAMRDKATTVPTRHPNAIDMCGTGGDGKGTFNISTVASFVVAGGGVAVAKHGNRSVSSRCGSADVLAALGVKIDLTAEQMSQCLDEVGMAFLFAPTLHSATKHAVGPRREIGTRTVFNILGPLTNPAGVKRQLLGVYDRRLAILMAEVLAELGTEHALVVHSDDGLDEISIFGPTQVVELYKGRISERTLTPKDFGFVQSGENGIIGGDAGQNARIALRILEGEPGPGRDIVVTNAAGGFVVAGVAKNIAEGIALARKSIDSGAAREKLEALRTMSNRFS